MLQTEILDLLTKAARDTKTKITRKHRADLPTMMMVFRAGEPLAQITLQHGGRNFIAEAARMAIVGFDADSIGVFTESYQCNTEKNPLTGEDWSYPNGSGDRGWMQILAEDHDGIEKGWIHECISIFACNRAGDVNLASLPYRYVGKSHISWIEGDQKFNSLNIHGGVSGGYLVDQLLNAMNEPGLSQRMDHDMSRESRDVSTACLLNFKGHAVMLWRDGVPTKLEFLTVNTPS